MKRVQIDLDEWYPVYTETDSEYKPQFIDMPDDLYRRWQRTIDEFDAAQREVGEIYWKTFPR